MTFVTLTLNFFMYSFFKFILFLFPPEIAHKLAMQGIRLVLSIPVLNKILTFSFVEPVNFTGIKFKNKLSCAT